MLVKHWMTEVIDYEFFWFCYQQTSSSASRRSAFGGRRISRIAAFIGEDAVQRAVDEAYEESVGSTNLRRGAYFYTAPKRNCASSARSATPRMPRSPENTRISFTPAF